MIFVWMIVWLFHSTPKLEHWNNWMVALGVCMVMDTFSLIAFKIKN